MKVRFKKIDAFATSGSSGNPAAVVFLDRVDELSESAMLQLAKELKGFVSEVGYVAPGIGTDFRLRYFSSEREVAFCGHATIAIMYDLIANDPQLQQKAILTIETQHDRLQVENRFRDENSVYICAPLPRFSDRNIPVASLASALHCEASDLDAGKPVTVVNAGLETLIVPMAGLSQILAISPDLEQLNAFCTDVGVDIMILYTDETADRNSDYRTRVFAPTFGYLEDPATGSGNSALAAHLLQHKAWDGTMLRIEQNRHRDKANMVHLFARQDEHHQQRIWFGGGATVRIDGHYHIADPSP